MFGNTFSSSLLSCWYRSWLGRSWLITIRSALVLRHSDRPLSTVQFPARHRYRVSRGVDCRSWIGAALFLAPAIGGGEVKAKLFVDVLFWVTLFVVAVVLVGNYLGIMGYIHKGWSGLAIEGLSTSSLDGPGRLGSLPALPSGAFWSSALCGGHRQAFGRRRFSSGSAALVWNI